jgi:acyl-CoA synthetase (AMP-forming)/AMP-acid ligase II
MPSSLSKSTGAYATIAVAATYAGLHAYTSRNQDKYNDGIDVKNQSVEIDPVEHIRRCTFYKDVDIYSYYKTIYPSVQTLGDVFYHGYSISNNGPCLTNVDLSNKISPLHWISYSIALEQIRSIGSHLWTEAKLTPMQSKVAIISVNRAEYSFVEHACYMYGFIVVALYTSYDSATILSMLEKTNTEVLVVDNFNRIKSFKNELFQNTQLKEILIMDELTNREDKKIKTIPKVLKTMQQADVRPLPKIDPDSIATFILTSGKKKKKRKIQKKNYY